MSVRTDAGTAGRAADASLLDRLRASTLALDVAIVERRLARPRAHPARRAGALVRRGVHLAADPQGLHRAVRGLPAVLLLDPEAVDEPRGNLGVGACGSRPSSGRCSPRRFSSCSLASSSTGGSPCVSGLLLRNEPVRRQVVAAGAGLPAPARREPRRDAAPAPRARPALTRRLGGVRALVRVAARHARRRRSPALACSCSPGRLSGATEFFRMASSLQWSSRRSAFPGSPSSRCGRTARRARPRGFPSRRPRT